MRVLFLAPEPPSPAISGARIRNLNLIRGLALNHQVSLVTFGGESAATASELRSLCETVEYLPTPRRSTARRVFDQTNPEPDLALRLLSPPLAARVAEVVTRDRPDLVHVGGLEMAFAAYRHRGRAAILFDEHNAEYVLQRRAFENECRRGGNPVGAAYSLLQWAKLRRFEARCCRDADGVMAVSDVDARAIRQIAGDVPLAVVPNSIDVDDYPVRPQQLAASRRVVFTGKMDFRPNVDAVRWFAAAVWPRVRAGAPDAEFLIVGRSPTEIVRRLGETPGITVTGEVPDDRSYVEQSAVFVVPMRVGGGVRIKVLQAMAAGVPVVSTSLGYEGVSATPGEHLYVEDEPDAFASAILALLGEPSRATAITLAARALVAERYDWRALAGRLDEFYRQTAQRAADRLSV